MTKEELAEKYVKEISNSLSDIVRDAFLNGYQQGELKSASNVCIDGVKYIDLGLPSGILWSEEPILNKGQYRPYIKLPCEESQKLNIPTVENARELMLNVRALEGLYSTMYLVGPNGKRIHLSFREDEKGEGCAETETLFWLKHDNNKGRALQVLLNKQIQPTSHFTGYRLPVFLVKSKEEI